MDFGKLSKADKRSGPQTTNTWQSWGHRKLRFHPPGGPQFQFGPGSVLGLGMDKCTNGPAPESGI